MKIIFVTVMTPAPENIRGTSALPYHLMVERDTSIEIEAYSFNLNNLNHEQICQAESDLNIKIHLVKQPLWFKLIFRLHLLFLRLFLSYPLHNYIMLPQTIVDEIDSKSPDGIWIYGDGNHRKKLENMIKERKLEGIVSLCGISNNIIDAYLQSSFFVLSSREEGFGLVLTEAETCGLPIVTFACPNGPAEIVEDGYNGIVVKDKENIEELAKAMKKMIGDGDMRKEMGKNSLKVVNRFSIPIIKSQWIQMFNQL